MGISNHAGLDRLVVSEPLAGRNSALRQIPSAIMAETWNWMLNPSHRDASGIATEWGRQFTLDLRLAR